MTPNDPSGLYYIGDYSAEDAPLMDGHGALIDADTYAAAEADPDGPEAARVLGLDAPTGATLPGFATTTHDSE